MSKNGVNSCYKESVSVSIGSHPAVAHQHPACIPSLPPALVLLTTSNPTRSSSRFSAWKISKSDAKKRAEMMAKEWKKSWCTTRTLNDLIEMELLHNQELGGWRAPEGESYLDPRAGEIVIFEDFSRWGLGYQFIHFFRGCFFTMRSGSAIYTRTLFCSWRPSFTFVRRLLALSHISIFSITYSA